MDTRKVNIDYILICFFFFLIPTAPLFSNFVLYSTGGILLFLFILLVIKKGLSIKITSFELLYLLFLIWNLISLKWSISSDKYVIKYGVLYFMMTIIPIRLYCIINSESKHLKDDLFEDFSKWFILGTILISVICILYENPFSSSAVRLGTYVFREPYGTRMMYTYNLEISIFILLYKFYKEGFNNRKIIYLLGCLFITLCILLSGTRKILIGVVFYSIAYIIIENRKMIFKIIPKLLAGVSFCLLLYFLMIKVSFFYNLIGNRIETGINYFFDNESVDYSMRDRNAMIDYALLKFKEKPIIGNGTNTFHTMFEKYYGQDLYAHNTFVELLCDVGIIGFILYYGIYIFIIIKYHDDKYSNLIICTLLTLILLDWWTITYYRIYFMIFLELSSLYFQKQSNIKKELSNEKSFS